MGNDKDKSKAPPAFQHLSASQKPPQSRSVIDQARQSQIIGREWKTMASSEREKWVQRAAAAKQEHSRLYPNYKYKPSAPKSKVHKKPVAKKLKRCTAPTNSSRCSAIAPALGGEFGVGTAATRRSKASACKLMGHQQLWKHQKQQLAPQIQPQSFSLVVPFQDQSACGCAVPAAGEFHTYFQLAAFRSLRKRKARAFVPNMWPACCLHFLLCLLV